MMIALINRVSRKLKGRDVSIDSTVPSAYLIGLMIKKLLMLLRGLLFSRRQMLLGRGVQLSALSQLHCQKGVEIGDFTIVDCLSHEGISIGRGSKIGAFSIVQVSGSLSDLGKGIHIGSNVGLGDFAHIGGAGGVVIGDDTITGAYLSIHPENHNYADEVSPIRSQGVTRKGITIGSNCWIGAKVTFLDGSSIGSGCVVAAGAVVTKSFGDNVIIGGVPAKVIGQRVPGDPDN